MENLDYSKIDNVQLDGVNYKDAPDYADAFIQSADYEGRPMNEEELDLINEDSDFIHEQIFNKNIKDLDDSNLRIKKALEALKSSY